MRLRTLAFLAALLFPWTLLADFPTPAGHVTDAADVLDPASEERLDALLSDVEAKIAYQVAVVTVPSLDGMTVEDYAVKLFERWGIGDKKRDNGVLILFARDDRQMRIETGYGVEGDLPDAAAGDIIRQYMVPRFRAGDYAGGLWLGAAAVAERLGYTGAAEDLQAARRSSVSRGLDPWTLAFWAIFLLVFIINGIMANRRRFHRGGWHVGGFGGGFGGGMGGFGGGGGGFGGFGGGSSGGGGASGRW